MSAHDNPQWGSPPPPKEAPRTPFDSPGTKSGSDQGFGPESEPALGHQCVELCPICRGAEILRATGVRGGPGELRGQLDDMGREALLTLRALVDHYLERIDERPSEPTVEEIPID